MFYGAQPCLGSLLITPTGVHLNFNTLCASPVRAAKCALASDDAACFTQGGALPLFGRGKRVTLAVSFLARQSCVTWAVTLCKHCPAKSVALVNSPTRLGSNPNPPLRS
jgi:hypothetical protein